MTDPHPGDPHLPTSPMETGSSLPHRRPNSVGTRTVSPATAQERTDALLRDLWQRKLPAVRDHLRLLERARDLLTDAELHAPLRTEAAIAAHKLAGSLGMFGYSEGTSIARELEAFLDSPLPPNPALFAQLVQQLRSSLSL